MCFYGLNDEKILIFVLTTVRCSLTLWKLGKEGKEKQEITHPLERKWTLISFLCGLDQLSF